MKESLSHLPGSKQYEIARITDIIREVLNPEMIILFGSYAKGTYVEHKYQGGDRIRYEYISDYDFLVVLKEVRENIYEPESTIMDRADQFEPPVNLEIHDIEYINYGLERGQYFFTEIVNDGIVLYDTKQVSFKAARQLLPEEEKQQAKEYFDIWFIDGSKNFWQASEAAFKLAGEDSAKLNVSVFILHQATERLFYAILLVFTGYKPKTHSLWRLRRKAKAYSRELFQVFKCETDKHDKHIYDLLHRGYIDARYKKEYKITASELGELLNRVSEMQSIAEAACLKKIESI